MSIGWSFLSRRLEEACPAKWAVVGVRTNVMRSQMADGVVSAFTDRGDDNTGLAGLVWGA